MASGSGTSASKSTQNQDLKEIRKALFQSPGSFDDTSQDAIKTLLNRLQIEHDVDVSLKLLQREEHEKRLTDLRQLQEQLQQDNWKYRPIEELIGLQ